MSFLLTEPLPDTVEVGALKLPIDTDFRTWIKLEALLLEEELSQGDKMILALELIYPNPVPPFFIAEALEKVFWFYTCGKEAKESEGAEDTEEGEAAFSYEADAPYLYAAFLEQYGIDLIDTPLHWWKFQALMKGLNPNSLFVKIMGYRKIKLTADMPAEKREFYSKMKKLYALPATKEESKRQNLIEEALLNGGDLSGIL